jgi:hypothetical protein
VRARDAKNLDLEGGLEGYFDPQAMRDWLTGSERKGAAFDAG